jgi:hypothetical protein
MLCHLLVLFLIKFLISFFRWSCLIAEVHLQVPAFPHSFVHSFNSFLRRFNWIVCDESEPLIYFRAFFDGDVNFIYFTELTEAFLKLLFTDAKIKAVYKDLIVHFN